MQVGNIFQVKKLFSFVKLDCWKCSYTYTYMMVVSLLIYVGKKLRLIEGFDMVFSCSFFIKVFIFFVCVCMWRKNIE